MQVQSPEGDRVSFTPKGLSATTASIVLGFDGETRTIRIRKGSGLIEITDLDDPWFDAGL